MSAAAQTGHVSPSMCPHCAGTIGRRIKTVRAALGISQHVMALQLGIADKTIKNYEGGHRDPPSSLIAAICEQFHIDAAWLLLGDASRPMFQHEQARVA